MLLLYQLRYFNLPNFSFKHPPPPHPHPTHTPTPPPPHPHPSQEENMIRLYGDKYRPEDFLFLKTAIQCGCSDYLSCKLKPTCKEKCNHYLVCMDIRNLYQHLCNQCGKYYGGKKDV